MFNNLAMRAELLKEYYDSSIAGHIGFCKILKLLKRSYYWDFLYYDIKNYINICTVC